MANDSFWLRPARFSDVNIMVDIFGAAFRNDRHTQLKALEGNDPSNMMNEVIDSWMKRPARCSVIKAVDIASNEILGWVCWAIHGYEELAGAILPVSNTNNETNGTTGSQATPQPEFAVEQEQSSTEESKKVSDMTLVEKLESLTNADMEHWEKLLMPEGKKCKFICCIVVAPDHQSRGVGSALIRWGTKKADADGVSCWVQASEAAHGAFAKEGFKEVGRLEVDLDEYATGPYKENSNDEKWGTYTFRYMVRDPKG